MSAMLDQRLIVEPFHLERSHLLDAFVVLEEQIVRLLAVAGVTCAYEALGHKIESLKAIKASPRISKTRLAAIHALVPEIQELAVLRATIVHARLNVARIEGAHKACFVNARYNGAEIQPALLLDLAALAGLSARARSLGDRLDRCGIRETAAVPPVERSAA